MDYSITFARHFARLLWLLLHEPENVEEQKASLRALVMVSRDGPVTLTALDDRLQANGADIAAVVSGAREAAAQMAAHGAEGIAFQVAAQAADILTAARLLAQQPGGSAVLDEQLKEAGSLTVHFRMAVSDAGQPVGFDLVTDMVEPIEPTLVPQAVTEAPPPRAVDPRGGSHVYQQSGSLFDHFAAVRPADGTEGLIAELRAAPDAGVAAAMNRVAHVAEQAQRDGDGRALLTIVLGIIAREEGATDGARREIAIVLRRIVTAHALRLIAAMVPRRAVPRDQVERALARAGDDGADAVIELLTQSQTATDRRAYFDLLLTLKAGVPTLMHMLGDDRWYVVRNAVDLLGELGTAEAEQPITRLLDHADERVRQSAMMALLRMNTPAGRAAILAAVQSDSSVRRQQAVLALGARKDANTATMLLRALDREADDVVLRSIYAALGKVASPDAVKRLVDAAQPSSGIFRRKPVALRVAAVVALGESRTPAAVDALRRLAGDKEREVREAAVRALASARRGNEPRVTQLFEAVKPR